MIHSAQVTQPPPSAALGIAKARDLKGEDVVVAVTEMPISSGEAFKPSITLNVEAFHHYSQ